MNRFDLKNFFLKIIFVVIFSLLTSCVSMILPDFAQEEMRQQKLMEKNHPESLQLLKTSTSAENNSADRLIRST